MGVGEEKKRAKFWAVRRRGVRSREGPASGGEGPEQTTTQQQDHNNTQQHNTKMDWPKMDWPKLADPMGWPKMGWPTLVWPKSATTAGTGFRVLASGTFIRRRKVEPDGGLAQVVKLSGDLERGLNCRTARRLG